MKDKIFLGVRKIFFQAHISGYPGHEATIARGEVLRPGGGEGRLKLINYGYIGLHLLIDVLCLLGYALVSPNLAP